MNATIERETFGEHTRRVMRWLSAPDTTTNFYSAKSKHHASTGSWFLEHTSFLEWQAGTRSFLWLHGLSGCGKTVLSSTIIEHLRSTQVGTVFPVLMFFFDFNDSSKQSVDSLVRSLVSQLYLSSELCRSELDSLYVKCGDGNSNPSIETLVGAFIGMVCSVGKVYLVVDALDECETLLDLLGWMKNVSTSTHGQLYMVATSRPERELETGIEAWVERENFINLQQALVNPDICDFVRATLHAADGGFQRWRSRPLVLNEIEVELTEKADGM